MMGESNAGNHKELDDFGFDNPNHHENEEGNHLAEMLQEPHFNVQWTGFQKESESTIPISISSQLNDVKNFAI